MTTETPLERLESLMSRRVASNRLALLHVELQRRSRPKAKNGLKCVMGEVDMREYSCIVEELRRRRGDIGRKRFNRAPLTDWMIASRVGDVTTIAPKTSGAITTCRTTARKVLNNVQARWRADTLDNGRVRIERRPDGEDPGFARHRSPIVLRMAAMNLNGRGAVDRQHRRIPHAYKVIARQLMDNPHANWRYTHLTTGRVKIVRVA